MGYRESDKVTLNKEKLLNDLKAQIGNIDNKNDLRLVYQIGRNSIASYFFVAISSGDYDMPKEEPK